ncbi:Helicase associated domain protein [Streptomyces sp. NPDC052069]|uniref:DEAD/DEAH box helicase n=1 Tax=Streptomyces sp. NPDC052069 TaxID=3154650 RepID=UPI00343C4458
MALGTHQVEAVDGVLCMLATPGEGMPGQGLRTQVIAATGSGKTLIGVEAANRLNARRVLVLVPTLDLLVQMAGAWRRGGRHGAMVGVCSLRAEESEGIPCTTDPDELTVWVRDLDVVTVVATYASLAALQRAHGAGLPPWDLMVVDEAHRTSGDAGKPWAAVHDQERLPAARRLYMTATPRVWEAPEGGTAAPRLVASMDADSPVFGPVAYELKLSEAIRRGIVAPYQVLCLDIRDPGYQAALLGGGTGSQAARGARLAAVQTGLMRAAVEERIRRVLAFHSRVAEAEAMAAGVPAVAAALTAEDPDTYPPADRVWADWLCGEHAPAHRRNSLAEFASDFLGGNSDILAALRVLSSVKVLGEGVDTAECDAVLFADSRGSMVDIVQMVGRALRTRPGRGKLATLIVPVFLGAGESGDEMVTSDAYTTLAKVLGALRAHDTETIEALADPRVRSGREHTGDQDQEGQDVKGQEDGGQDVEGRDVEVGVPAARVSSPAAAGVLRFSEERDPVAVARFLRLRVIDPEGAYWRRGVEAAGRWLRESGGSVLRVPYMVVTPEDWGGVGGYPLGQWIAEQRRAYAAGTLESARVVELEQLGMVWSERDAAWADGVAVAAEYAEVHGHLLPPTGAVWKGYPIGVWVKNARAAARKAAQIEELRAAGQPVASAAGAMTRARRDELDAIDPGWCPAWDISWQRVYRLTHNHVRAGGSLPEVAGEVVVQGEDFGRWVSAQRHGWDRLLLAQRWILEHTLGLSPVVEAERPVTRTQDAAWAVNLAAAQQFHGREGHLRAPRKHVEHVETDGALAGRQNGADGVVTVRLGTWLDNIRKRADKLTEQRRAELDRLGMRW